MPTLSMFYGIIIYMYFFDNKEHKAPHIHANYGEYDAIISIPDGKVLNGEMPGNMLKITKVNASDDYTLFVELSDGRSGCFDVKPYLDKGVFTQLRSCS